jgi:muconate cycloisomerase
MRYFDRDMGDICGWMGLAGGGPPGSIKSARFSMVLASGNPASLRRQARLAHWLGFRHFKLKVGMADDTARVAAVREILGKAILAGRTTLRLDANSAWDLDAAIAWLKRHGDLLLAGVEQPMGREHDEDLIPLKEQTGQRMVHDESLVTMADAERLVELGVADAFNIRLSKCGGLLPSLRLAAYARARKVEVQLGCMVGETSILSAAGLRFLECVPSVRFVEGCFGSLLLADDVVRKGLRFGLGGRLPRLRGLGWGIDVDEERLRRLCVDRPVVMAL